MFFFIVKLPGLIYVGRNQMYSWRKSGKNITTVHGEQMHQLNAAVSSMNLSFNSTVFKFFNSVINCNENLLHADFRHTCICF